ncbi:angio-associated migratory cell protein-like, partial [Macrobrachium nipponense]|uniref:angio-associated migratory cell protein-like n=1 Tax=Macrobrachium nipponense TaxID=159736 RepID=UPI0030C8BC66
REGTLQNEGKYTTSSPHTFENGDGDELEPEEIDFGEVEEVIDLDGSVYEEEEDMEEDESIPDMSSVKFSQHKGSVFACSFSSNGLVATGGEDDVAHIWNAKDGSLLYTCTGHKDSVTCLAISHDSNFLATGDMSGYIQVWKIAGFSKIWEFETGDLSWLAWHHGSHVLLAGTMEGDLWMWLVPQGNARTFPSYGSTSQCGAFLPDGKRAVSGYDDGSVRVFDLKSGELKCQFSGGLAHSGQVTSISVHKDNALVMSGSSDGTAKLFNTVSGKVVGTLNCDAAARSQAGDDDDDDDAHVENSVEAVSFCPLIPNIAVTSTLSGLVIIWDISTQVIRHTIVQGCGTTQLVWHPTEPIVFAAGLDGVARVYDVRSGDLLKKYTGHQSSIFYMDILKDGTALATASDDGTCRVFNLTDS